MRILIFLSVFIITGCVQTNFLSEKIRSQIVRKTPPNHREILSGSPLEKKVTSRSIVSRAGFWGLFPLQLFAMSNFIEYGETTESVVPPNLHDSSVTDDNSTPRNMKEMLTSQDSTEKQMGIEFLKYAQDTPSNDLLNNIAKEQDPYARVVSIRILSEKHPDIALLHVDEWLSDPDKFVRAETVRSLSEIKKKVVLPYVYQALEDEAALVRGEAISSLMALGYKDSIPKLWKTLQDEVAYVRKKGGQALEILTQIDVDYSYRASQQSREKKLQEWKEKWKKSN